MRFKTTAHDHSLQNRSHNKSKKLLTLHPSIAPAFGGLQCSSPKMCQITMPLLTHLAIYVTLFDFIVQSSISTKASDSCPSPCSVSHFRIVFYWWKCWVRNYNHFLLSLVFIFRVQCNISYKYRSLISKILVKEKWKTTWGVKCCSQWLLHCICNFIYFIKKYEGLWFTLTLALSDSDGGSS